MKSNEQTKTVNKKKIDEIVKSQRAIRKWKIYLNCVDILIVGMFGVVMAILQMTISIFQMAIAVGVTIFEGTICRSAAITKWHSSGWSSNRTGLSGCWNVQNDYNPVDCPNSSNMAVYRMVNLVKISLFWLRPVQPLLNHLHRCHPTHLCCPWIRLHCPCRTSSRWFSSIRLRTITWLDLSAYFLMICMNRIWLCRNGCRTMQKKEENFDYRRST